MREKLYITFHSEDEIRHFVDTCNEFDDAIDIRIQKTAMDAKSLLGMLLMKTEEPLEIEYACYDDEDNYEEIYSDEERKKLLKVVLNHPEDVIARMFVILFCMPLRLGEVRSIKWSDVDFENHTKGEKEKV